MCGQCGLILTEPGPVGALLSQMESAMIHRGPDSTGFALYGPPPSDERVVVRARLAEASRAEETLREVIDRIRRIGVELVADPTVESADATRGAFVRMPVRFEGSVPVLLEEIESVPGVYVHSMGRRLEIVKDVGDAATVATRHQIEGFVGTHGLAHSRLATESIVDVEYSHPFWARPFLDVAIAHNGQLTNYYRMRRLMAGRGFRFLTSNDSELIAVCIAERLAAGSSLRAALAASIDVLDGVFTYLLATCEAIGCATDRLAIKPLVVAETPAITVMATEEQAIRHILADEVNTATPAEGSATVWPAPSPTVAITSGGMR